MRNKSIEIEPNQIKPNLAVVPAGVMRMIVLQGALLDVAAVAVSLAARLTTVAGVITMGVRMRVVVTSIIPC